MQAYLNVLWERNQQELEKNLLSNEKDNHFLFVAKIMITMSIRFPQKVIQELGQRGAHHLY